MLFSKVRQIIQFFAHCSPQLLRPRAQRVLFQRYAGIGDIICTFPAVLALREKLGGAAIVYRVDRRFAPIVNMAQIADVVLPMDNGEWTLPRSCEEQFGHVFRPLLAGEVQGKRHQHLVDDFAETLGVTLVDRQPKLYVSSQERKRAARRLGVNSESKSILIGIQTGPSWKVREWTSEGWTQLIDELSRRLDVRVLQFGADHDTGKGPAKAFRVPGAEDWVGRCSLRDTVASISCCDLFIGIDSGMIHIAGALGVPVVGLFGAVDPILRMPPDSKGVAVLGDAACVGCHHRDPTWHWRDGCPNDIECMKGISVNSVIEAVAELIYPTTSVCR